MLWKLWWLRDSKGFRMRFVPILTFFSTKADKPWVHPVCWGWSATVIVSFGIAGILLEMWALGGQVRGSEVRTARHPLSDVDISWLSTSRSPICAHCMSSQHSNPGLFILTALAPITSFGTGREDMYPVCYRPAGDVCVFVYMCVCEWVKDIGGQRAWWGVMVGSRKLAKRSKVRGESRMVGLCCRCHSVTTQLPGIWC